MHTPVVDLVASGPGERTRTRGFPARVLAWWLEIAGYLGEFQSRWFLTAFYYTVGAPFGVITRALDPLRTRRPPPATSWLSRSPEEATLEASRRQ